MKETRDGRTKTETRRDGRAERGAHVADLSAKAVRLDANALDDFAGKHPVVFDEEVYQVNPLSVLQRHVDTDSLTVRLVDFCPTCVK